MLLSGNRQTGVSMLANGQIVGSVGFNDSVNLGQLNITGANQNAVIGFQTLKSTGISITSISTAANAVVNCWKCSG